VPYDKRKRNSERQRKNGSILGQKKKSSRESYYYAGCCNKAVCSGPRNQAQTVRKAPLPFLRKLLPITEKKTERWNVRKKPVYPKKGMSTIKSPAGTDDEHHEKLTSEETFG